MLARIFCAIALFLCILNAAPYKPYDHEAMLKKDENGRQTIDIGGIFRSTDELWKHARQYPLNFDSSSDKERAFGDLKTLEKVFAFLKEQGFTANFDNEGRHYFEVLLARIFVMEHNFDVAGAAQKADEAYKNLLAQHPNDGELHAEFGDFLGNSGRMDEAKGEFETALKLGQKRAQMGLVMVCLMQKDQICAKTHLKEFLKFRPNDGLARDILRSIEEGSLEIK